MLFKDFIQGLLDFFVYSNVWVAICFCGLVVETYYQFNLPVENPYTYFVFYASVFLYLLHRLKAVLFHQILPVKRHQWIAENKPWAIFLLIFSGIIGFYFFWKLSYYQQISITLLGVLAIFYSAVYYQNGQWTGLRDVPYLKIFLLTAVIVAVTYLVPVVDFLPQKKIWPGFVERYIFLFALIVPFDIRDMKTDQSDIKTIPMLIGKRYALMLSVFLFIISAIMAMLLYSVQHAWVVMLTCIVSIILTVISHNQTKNEFYYSFFMESPMLIRGLLFILVGQFFR